MIVDKGSGGVRVNLLASHKPQVDCIKRSILKDDVEKQLGVDRKRYKSKDIKSRLDTIMAAHGFEFIKDSERFGVAVKVSYIGCKHRDAQFFNIDTDGF